MASGLVTLSETWISLFFFLRCHVPLVIRNPPHQLVITSRRRCFTITRIVALLGRGDEFLGSCGVPALPRVDERMGSPIAEVAVQSILRGEHIDGLDSASVTAC